MKAFPMFIRTSDRSVVIVGGGEQAAQKARLILKTDAHIVIVAHKLEEELQSLVSAGRAIQEFDLSADVLEGAAMVFIGTGCPGLDAAAHALAKACGCLVNVVDQPELCDMTTPAIVDRDPIVVAIGSEGTAPVLTRDIKTKLEETLPVNIGGLAALAGRLRPSVTRQISRDRRRAFWAWVFKGSARDQWVHGREREAARAIKSAIAEGGAQSSKHDGHISLVGAGPGARDLLTLRAVERLQEADVIFYDRLVDPHVLELARRDAERVFVGKQVGANAWPQDKICALIVAEARKGRKVVRLKSGDPGIFGRASEELDAARAAGLSVDLVPGVTAASAAGAALGQSLTERSVCNTLVLATASGCADDPLPDAVRMAGPGTTVAIYMGVAHAERVSSGLMQKGLPSKTKVKVVADATKPKEQVLHTTLESLAQDIAERAIVGCAIIVVQWPKHGAAPAAASSRSLVAA